MQGWRSRAFLGGSAFVRPQMFQCCLLQLCFTTPHAHTLHTLLQSIRKNEVSSRMWDEVGNSSGIFSSDDLFLQTRAVLCAFIQGTKPCLRTQLLLLAQFKCSFSSGKINVDCFSLFRWDPVFWNGDLASSTKRMMYHDDQYHRSTSPLSSTNSPKWKCSGVDYY